MMKIYNNNSAFGDCGPFDIDAPTFKLACFELANEMRNSFEQWVRDQESHHVSDAIHDPSLSELPPRDVRMAEMRREFLKGLTEVAE